MVRRFRFLLRRRGLGPLVVGGRIVAVVSVVVVLLLSGLLGAAQADVYPDAEGSVHAASISALASDSRAILAGTDCEGGRFCPDDPLLRWVMAVWLVRALDGAEPDPSGGSSFADVDSSLWWVPYTNRLGDLGVTRGCRDDPPRYCPDRPVTRGEMASFLARAFELVGGTTGRFSDTATSPHAENIDKLAAAGITTGCGQGLYCPDRDVTRAEMATFLARALKLVPLPGATPIADEYRFAYSMWGTSPGPTEGRYGWAYQIWMAGLQGSRRFIGWHGSHGGDHPIFSPDGNWVAYGIDDKGYVMNTDSRDARQVLTRDRWSYSFRWSPDSRHLVYNSTGGVGDTNWIERSDGENRRSIGLLWRFSPDGRLALYSVFNQVGGERIYSHTVVEDLESGIRVNIDVDESNVRYAEFTPDSQKISWVAQSPTSSQQDLWMMDVDGRNKVKLLTAVVGDLPGSAKIRWSPDGSRFAYVKGYGIGTRFLVADAATGDTIMDLGISKCNYLNWAPDSVHLISDNREGFVFNTQTGDTIRQHDLYTGDSRYVYVRNVRWSPDNQALAYILAESDSSDGPVYLGDISTQLWIADADGQNKRKLVDANAGYDFRWSPDGTRIAYSILTPFGIEEHEGEQYPLSRVVSELWITNIDGSDRWMVAKPQNPGIRLLGWLPS